MAERGGKGGGGGEERGREKERERGGGGGRNMLKSVIFIKQSSRAPSNRHTAAYKHNSYSIPQY